MTIITVRMLVGHFVDFLNLDIVICRGDVKIGPSVFDIYLANLTAQQ